MNHVPTDLLQTTTDKLRSGDLVLTMGRIFRLTTRKERSVLSSAPLITFETELVRTLTESMPEAWIHSWVLVGTRRVDWSVVIDPLIRDSAGCDRRDWRRMLHRQGLSQEVGMSVARMVRNKVEEVLRLKEDRQHFSAIY